MMAAQSRTVLTNRCVTTPPVTPDQAFRWFSRGRGHTRKCITRSSDRGYRMSPHKEPRVLPLQAIARLVVLYRARHVPVYDWVTSEPSRHDLDHFVKAHHGRLSQTLAIGRDARAWMGVPVVPAASVAFLLLDDGN